MISRLMLILSVSSAYETSGVLLLSYKAANTGSLRQHFGSPHILALAAGSPSPKPICDKSSF
jgi:hypothetical protein